MANADGVAERLDPPLAAVVAELVALLPGLSDADAISAVITATGHGGDWSSTLRRRQLAAWLRTYPDTLTSGRRPDADGTGEVRLPHDLPTLVVELRDRGRGDVRDLAPRRRVAAPSALRGTRWMTPLALSLGCCPACRPSRRQRPWRP